VSLAFLLRNYVTGQPEPAALLIRPQSRRYHARSQIFRLERVRWRWKAVSVATQALQRSRYSRISDRLGHHADKWR
jgi:hypothetical protein